MAWRIPNAYSSSGSSDPLTAGANGINNIAWAMMSKMKSPEELEKIRQDTMLHKAQMEKTQFELDQARKAAALQESSIADYMRGRVGVTDEQMSALDTGMRTGSWGAPVEVETDPATSNGAEGFSRPATMADRGLTAQNLADYRAALQTKGGVGMTGSKDNVLQIAQADKQFTQNGAVAPLLTAAATGDPNAMRRLNQFEYAFKGSAPYHFDAHGNVGDNITGSVDSSSEPAQANLEATRALRDERKAAASDHNAGAALKRGQGATSNAQVPKYDEQGNLIGYENIPVLNSQRLTAATKEEVGAGHDDARLRSGGGKGGGTDKLKTKFSAQEIDAARAQLQNVGKDEIDPKTHGKLLNAALAQKTLANGTPDPADVDSANQFRTKFADASPEMVTSATNMVADVLKKAGKTKLTGEDQRKLRSDLKKQGFSDQKINDVLMGAAQAAAGKPQGVTFMVPGGPQLGRPQPQPAQGAQGAQGKVTVSNW